MYAIFNFVANLFILLLLILTTVKCDSDANRKKTSIRSVDVEKTKIWGPGLEPHKIILPVRYFYIQAIDAYGNP